MTEREKVLLQREAAAKALDNYLPVGDWNCARIQRLAAELFPLPKVTRPREAVISGGRYRYVVPEDGDGLWLELFLGHSWMKSYKLLGGCTAAELRAFADLRDHPTEEVEDEDE